MACSEEDHSNGCTERCVKPCPPLSIRIEVAGTLVFEWEDPTSCGPLEVAQALRCAAKLIADMPIMYATIGIEGKSEHATKVCGVPRDQPAPARPGGVHHERLKAVIGNIRAALDQRAEMSNDARLDAIERVIDAAELANAGPEVCGDCEATGHAWCSRPSLRDLVLGLSKFESVEITNRDGKARVIVEHLDPGERISHHFAVFALVDDLKHSTDVLTGMVDRALRRLRGR